jgi:thioredoxin 1
MWNLESGMKKESNTPKIVLLGVLLVLASALIFAISESGKSVEAAGTGELFELTSLNFEANVLDSHGPILVDFWAEWCGPCLVMHPTIEELAADYAGRASITSVNVDLQPELAAQFQVYALPTILFFKDGEPVDGILGMASKDALEEKLNQLLD